MVTHCLVLADGVHITVDLDHESAATVVQIFQDSPRLEKLDLQVGYENECLDIFQEILDNNAPKYYPKLQKLLAHPYIEYMRSSRRPSGFVVFAAQYAGTLDHLACPPSTQPHSECLLLRNAIGSLGSQNMLFPHMESFEGNLAMCKALEVSTSMPKLRYLRVVKAYDCDYFYDDGASGNTIAEFLEQVRVLPLLTDLNLFGTQAEFSPLMLEQLAQAVPQLEVLTVVTTHRSEWVSSILSRFIL